MANFPQRVDIPCWASWNSNETQWSVRETATSLLDLGDVRTTNTPGTWIAWKVALAAGTYTLTTMYRTDNQNGTILVTLGGVSVVTIDQYSGSAQNNVVNTTTGIAVAADGIYELKALVTGKNASSAAYYSYLQHFTLQRTGAYVAPTVLMAYHQDWPSWGLWDAQTGGVSREANSVILGGGDLYGSGSVNDSVSYQFDVAAGTYTLTAMYKKGGNEGIVAVTIDGVSVGSYDQYAATLAWVNVTTFAGIALAAGNHVVKLQTTTTNGSSSGYYNCPEWLSLDRTGA